MNKELKELTEAVNWLFDAKSPLVHNKNASFQQHAVSNITSIRRISRLLKISYAEALMLTKTGMNNGK